MLPRMKSMDESLRLKNHLAGVESDSTDKTSYFANNKVDFVVIGANDPEGHRFEI